MNITNIALVALLLFAGSGEESNKPLKLNPVPVNRKRRSGTVTRVEDLPGPGSIPRTDTSTTSTSIVVQYVDDDEEGYDPSAPWEERRVSLARKVPLEELSDSDKEVDKNDDVFLPVLSLEAVGQYWESGQCH